MLKICDFVSSLMYGFEYKTFEEVWRGLNNCRSVKIKLKTDFCDAMHNFFIEILLLGCLTM